MPYFYSSYRGSRPPIRPGLWPELPQDVEAPGSGASEHAPARPKAQSDSPKGRRGAPEADAWGHAQLAGGDLVTSVPLARWDHDLEMQSCRRMGSRPYTAATT